MATNPKNRIHEFERLEGTEIVAERGEFEKVYDLGLGRRQSIMYAAPVHYQDENGKWQEIDNTLETVEDTNGRSILRTRGNAVRMEFDKHRGAVRIAHKGRALSWRLLNSVEVAPTVVSGTELRQKNMARTGFRTNLDNPQDRRMNRGHKMNVEVDYINARPGLSLRYSVNGVRMKEDIILYNEAAADEAAILLPDDYDYTVDNHMRVLVTDKETCELLYRFETPLTTDAAGNETIAGVMLEPNAEGTVMRYVLDPQFLRDAEYPVTIDPVVTTPTTNVAVKDAYVYEKYPTQNFGDVHLMRSGTLEGNYSLSLIRFEKLTKLKASDTIISAQMRLCAQNHGSTTEYMGCFPILQEWDDMTVTWNSIGASDLVNNAYISRDLVAYVVGTSGARYFDLTPLYRDWYKANADGTTTSYGVAVHCPEGVNDSGDYVEWAASKYNADTAPCMIVNYVSHAGRQGWWQYESMSAGRAGTAYVDIFNGNLVYEHGDGSTTGNIMPVGLTHVYNSCLSESNPVGCGMGWRTSMHNCVNYRALAEENYYVWTDGGGTEHFFLKYGSLPYEDSEGMGLKLNISGSTLTITDKQHNVMTFPKPADTTQQYMTKIADALNNEVTLTYESAGKIKTITDGADRVIQFSYQSNLLSSLAIPGCPTLTFSYSGENLVGINYSDLTSGSTTFTYEAGSNLLIRAKNHDDNQLDMGFEAAGYYCSAAIENYAQQIRRVISLGRKNGSTVGAGMVIDYQHMTTKVTDNATGKTLTYLFNSAGNVVCVYDELGYAQSNTYSDTVLNQLTSSSRLHKAVINKLPNVDFSTGWTAIGSTIVQDTVTRCLGMPSVKITKSSASEAKYRASVTISEAGTYTFSAYVKNGAKLASGGLFVRIDGNSNLVSRSVTDITSALNADSAADGWDRVYVSATLSAGSHTFDLVSTAATGSAWFACPQLETGSIPNHVNLLLNGDFTRTYLDSARGQTFASDWSVSAGIDENAQNGIVFPTGNTDGTVLNLPTGLSGNGLRIHSYCNLGGASYCQSIAAEGNKNDVFVIGGWVNATSVYSGDTNKFRACLISRFKDTSGNWTDWQYNEFDTQRVGWKFAQWAIVAPKDYTEFRIGVQYARNHGTAMFSNVFIYREEFGNSFTYDEDKNVTSTAALSTQKSAMEYDDADNLKSYRQPGAADTVKYTMDYGSSSTLRKKHLLRTETTPTGVRLTHEYGDENGGTTVGNRLSTTNKPASGTTEFIKTSATYTSKGEFVATQKDARGLVTTLNTDITKGTLTSATGPDGQTVSYGYDAAKRVTSVQIRTGANNTGSIRKDTYTYDKDRITKVSHTTTASGTPDVSYDFGYDALGRKTTVKVNNSQQLSETVYKSNSNSAVSAVKFGASGTLGSIEYAHDSFNRVTGITKKGNNTSSTAVVGNYSFEYGANGQASIVRDHTLGRVFQSECDLAERPMGTQLRTTSGSLIYRSALDFDEQNRLAGFGEMTANGTHKTAFAYDNDNRPVTVTYGTAGQKVAYTYDKLGRMVTRKATNGVDFTATYGYVAGGQGTNSTTGMVASISQGNHSISYTYDNRGNIATETRNGKTITYTYSATNELVSVVDQLNDRRWVYAYDLGGNITSVTEYTATGTTVLSSRSFGYPSSGWKDVLASYNGVSVSHNTVGNLTQDTTWKYYWQAGRQLAKMEKVGNSSAQVIFQYDHNGMRVSKQDTQTGTTTNYILHGKQISELVQGSNVLHFYYDSQARPAMVSWNGVIYTYVHNLQGDIIAILDNTGAAVVTYSYDPWGALLAIGGSKAGNLGKLNPFRYRGYVYDDETGLYYLRSRYYKPEWCRFINSDTVLGQVGAVGSHNLFAYCGNNPVNRHDPAGNKWYDGIVSGWHNFWDDVDKEIKRQAQVSMDLDAAAVMNMRAVVDPHIEKVGAWLRQAGQDAWGWIKQAGKDTWNWLKNAASTIGNELQKGFHAQQQADILSAQMTYSAACKVGDWISSNITDWINKLSISYALVGSLIEGGALLGLYTIPVAGQVFMVATSIGFGIYAFVQEVS